MSTTQAPTVGADLEQLATMLDQLAAACNTLAAFLLSAPSQQVLDQVRDPLLLASWPTPPSTDRTAGIAHLTRSLQDGENQLTVRQDYNVLFVGPDRMKAPPYESVHLSQDKLVFEQQTFVVRAAYARFGLAAPKLNQEPDDHMGLELEFLATLAVKALDCIEEVKAASDLEAKTAELNAVLSAMHAFLDQHVLRWGPEFFTLIVEHAETEFYRGVGVLGLATLEHGGQSFGL